MSDTKLREQTERGQRAEIALQELAAAFEALQADCFDSFTHSEIHDDAGRKTCRIYLKVLDDVKTRFTVAVRNGEAARKELIRVVQTKQRKVSNG